MIRVPFDPADLEGDDATWWKTWMAKASASTAARAADANRDYDGSVWSELKVWLLANVFKSKCAYCEVKVTPGFFGDAEHYRPKGNVRDASSGTRRQARLPSGDDHPGYGWLAYDWRNLLPSCQKCNNAKSDVFEVAGDYVIDPDKGTAELNASERPLLIYPYDEDPSQYLRFGYAGVVSAIDNDPRGQATIRMLGLNRSELEEARWNRQAEAVFGLETEVGRMFTGGGEDQSRWDLYLGAAAPFSRAVGDWYAHRMKELLRRACERAGLR